MSEKSYSRVLRQLATDLLDNISKHIEISDKERQDWITSLVRQWISYDGQAALFIGGRQLQFALAYTPLGKLFCTPEFINPDWTPSLIEKWKMDPADLPEVFEQLNRCQNADAINRQGDEIHLSIDPKAQRRMVEKEALEEPATWDSH